MARRRNAPHGRRSSIRSCAGTVPASNRSAPSGTSVQLSGASRAAASPGITQDGDGGECRPARRPLDVGARAARSHPERERSAPSWPAASRQRCFVDGAPDVGAGSGNVGVRRSSERDRGNQQLVDRLHRCGLARARGGGRKVEVEWVLSTTTPPRAGAAHPSADSSASSSASAAATAGGTNH